MDTTSIPIGNCDLKFKFVCPKQWNQLASTSDAYIRFCPTCQKKVHYCLSKEEASLYAKEGKCVAIDDSVSDELVDEVIWSSDTSTHILGELEAP